LARLYSNENFAIDIVQILHDYGHDVLTSYDAGQANQGISDPEVLRFATNQNRILITFNRDDFIDLHHSGINHSGIIICKDDRDYQGQAKFINDFLQSQTTELSDRLIRIQKQNQPKSSMPIFIIREY
jgi:predicted nuclease of predicted toxin-antitoxin system